MRGVRSLLALAPLGIAVSACAVAVDESWLDGAPPPIGPQVELASGSFDGLAWEYLAYPTRDGFCDVVQFADRPATSDLRNCETADGAAGTRGWMDTGRPTVFRGYVSPSAARVRIETALDGPFETATITAPTSLGATNRFFVIVMPDAAVTTRLMVMDVDGAVIEDIPL